MAGDLERHNPMHEVEVLAKNEEDAKAKASERTAVSQENLEIIEEYEPDELDLKQYADENGLTELPAKDSVTLYVVRVTFAHYLHEAQEWTQGMIERFAPGAKAEAIRFKNIIIIRLEVPETSILIGKQGATLDALQHVVVRALLTKDESFPDVMLDVERYREKKLIRLEKEATNSAEKCLRQGRRVPLPPMSPAERKFIHNLLKDYEGIRTESRGEDRRRHIVIEAINPVRSSGPRERGGNFNRGNRPAGAGGNREGANRAGGNRAGGGGGGGGNRGAGGFRGGQGGGPKGRPAGAPITEEQRQLLYGKEQSAREFEDADLEEKKSLLPDYVEKPQNDDEDDSQLRFMDEIDDKLR